MLSGGCECGVWVGAVRSGTYLCGAGVCVWVIGLHFLLVRAGSWEPVESLSVSYSNAVQRVACLHEWLGPGASGLHLCMSGSNLGRVACICACVARTGLSGSQLCMSASILVEGPSFLFVWFDSGTRGADLGARRASVRAWPVTAARAQTQD